MTEVGDICPKCETGTIQHFEEPKPFSYGAPYWDVCTVCRWHPNGYYGTLPECIMRGRFDECLADVFGWYCYARCSQGKCPMFWVSMGGLE